MNDEGFARLAPSFELFREGFEAGRPQLLFRRFIGDLETPLSAYLKLTGDGPGSFLLESVEGGEQLGRYSTIGLEPDLIWRCRGQRAEMLSADGEVVGEDADPLGSLRKLIAENEADLRAVDDADLPPMASGLFGFFAYDFIRYAERLPDSLPDPLGLPDAYLVRPTVVATFDSVRREVVLVTAARPGPGIDPAAAYASAEQRLEEMISRLRKPLVDEPREAVTAPDFQSNMTPMEYIQAVKKGKDYIAAGDIFQVVLSQRWSTKYDGRPIDAYRQLRRINPSPFLFYLNFAPVTLLGASPEILVRVREGDVTIRPIAGTRPRGKTRAEDDRLETELLADAKERAEHLMLLDLGRNDVGRSAELGTVKPTETFSVERYSHVMHIISNVTGRLRSDLTPLDAMLNGFPAGTLSGAPKIRAMEIIDELEKVRRGAYAGAIGYFGTDNEFDSCIGLRMAVVKDGMVHVQAGAGIVHDSDPEAEQRECEAKAAAIKQAFVRAAAGPVQ